MWWDPQHMHAGAFAVGAAVVAVALFGLAPRLPAPFPTIMRLVCVWLVITSTTLLVLAESWRHGVVLGGAGLALIVAIHLAQTRRKPGEPVKQAGSEAAQRASSEKVP